MTPSVKPHIHVVSALSGFREFIKKQNVIGLAVGIILGSSAKGVVDALVTDIFNPFIGLLIGGVNLTNQMICLNTVGDVCTSKFAWGHFVTVLIQFIVVTAVVYFVIEKAVKFFMKDENQK